MTLSQAVTGARPAAWMITAVSPLALGLTWPLAVTLATSEFSERNGPGR